MTRELLNTLFVLTEDALVRLDGESLKVEVKKAAKITAGSKEPGKTSAGTVTMAQCREIAEQKLKGMNARDVDAAAREIAGSARSMGLQVVE